ncbi:hypothetical protein ACFQ07_34115 [Actinomadura adrarensis]|uniref:Uncharacterized protein n=1 Tax=Actinomadura adrarensis TaxID=1819600 RepID=A0ABW3CSV6_9ACTN
MSYHKRVEGRDDDRVEAESSRPGRSERSTRMEGVQESEHASVYHDPEMSAVVAECCGGEMPRLFALVREFDDENDQPVREVVAYGIALPNGGAATVGASGRQFGKWASPDAASLRMNSELVWLAG